MKTIILNITAEMPILGFGVFQVNAIKDSERNIIEAIEKGYLVTDTAASYLNE